MLQNMLLALLVKAATDRDTVTIQDVRARLDRATLERSSADKLSSEISAALKVISDWTERNKVPPVHALFIKRDGIAGIGFFRSQGFEGTPQDRELYWKSVVSEVYDFYDLGGNR